MKNFTASQFGTPADIAYIKTLNKRIIFADKVSGPINFWKGAPIQWYTDPIYRGHRKSLRATDLKKARRFQRGRDVLVISNQGSSQQQLRPFRRKFGDRSFRLLKTTPSFKFYQ